MSDPDACGRSVMPDPLNMKEVRRCDQPLGHDIGLDHTKHHTIYRGHDYVWPVVILEEGVPA